METVNEKTRQPETRTSLRSAVTLAGSLNFLVLWILALCSIVSLPDANAQVTAPVFGPQTYTRTTGPPNEYTTTFTAPAWIVSPYDLHIVNGDSKGNNRISSATISLNGVQVAGPSDFNQNVATIDKTVTLQAGSNTLQVTLASKPGSYITINVYGTSGDKTPPQINIVTPANSSYTNTATPNIEVTYSDPVGTGDPAASGVNTATFKATLDGVDRTSLFTVRSGDASATIPKSLALTAGAHTLVISLQDNAGNQDTATSKFTVELGAPAISITQPVLGAYINTPTPTISIQYSDSVGVNLSTLKVLINGVDETSLFTKTSTSATATLPPANALPSGANQIVAQIQNVGGTQASASTSFNVDTTAPTISFSHPAPNSYHGSSTIDIAVQYSDDQAIDVTKLQVSIDGTAVSMTTTATSATGTVTNVANGTHTLVAGIKDLAGNANTAQITFYVDTTVPTIHVDQPAPSALLNTSTPAVTIDYTDILGVNLSTLKVYVNNADATSLFTVTSTSATAQLTSAFAMPDGQNTIAAQITNNAGTTGTASSEFTVDTTPPAIAIQAPPARTNSNTPTATIAYSDATSGVDPYSLKVTLDGSDVSTLVAPGANSATGVLQLNPPLTDGTHTLSATVKDRAGNQSQAATLSFVVDTKPPTISFIAPADNSFINNPTPTITLQYSDGTGTGVSSSSVEIFLQQGSNQATDITSDFQIGAQQATGAIPSAASLNDGTYVVSAVVSDQVGNSGNAHATFVVDTVPPTGVIQAPAANAILNVAAVPVTITYSDDRSGIDTTKTILTVDGVNQTSALTLTATQATGTLPALTDGVHTIQLTVYDRSGNASSAISQQFTTDTTPPAIIVSVSPTPNAAGWNNNTVTVTFACSDAGSGVTTCPPPVSVSSEGRGQSVCGQAVDAAGNSSAPACATVNLDRTPPVITYSVSPVPNSNGIITSTPVTITFSCSDALSGVANCTPPIVVNTTGLSQMFTGTATDLAGNSATASVTLNIQTVAPTPPTVIASVSPAPNSKGWNNSNVTVTFTCSPGTNPVSVCPLSVSVSNEGANQQFCGKAIDTTGLSSTACATVNLDKTPPTITAAASPAPSLSGWNTAPVTVTFACSDSLSGVATCPAQQTLSTEGLHQTISGTAVDVAGNSSAPAQVTLNIDQTPPVILQFTAPSQLAPGQSGTATVTATDNIGVASVVIQLNGATIATLSAPPYTATFSLPTTASAGATETLTAIAYDAAGNATSSARGFQVVPSGVVTGQVLSDITGLPFAGATVQAIGGGQDTSDNQGQYSISSNSPNLFLSITAASNSTTGAAAMVNIDRQVTLQSGVGTVPVDARMTPVAAPVSIGPTGGTLTAGNLTITVAPNAVSSATNFHLTSLSQQGLPGLLPLGWSPVSTFDLRADSSTTASFTAAFTQMPSATLQLVQYNYNSHNWLMVTPNLTASQNSLSVPIPSVGDFALVVADTGSGAPAVPAAGQPLAGVPMVTLPAGASATGSLSPPSASPTGGTSTATLSVQSSVPLPSGTVIQANVEETYSLTSGKQLSSPRRTEDILLYQYSAPTGAAAVASFPVTPSQTFQPAQLASGDVHLDILSGRESIRGQVGGSDAATVTGGDATLTISAGSLPQDTAISVAPENLDTFLPATASLVPLAEYNLDFSGETLQSPAQLSVAAGTAQAGNTVLLAQVQRINDVPYLVVVSLAQVNGSSMVTQAVSGLSGITQGGDYVFYKLTSPSGYVSGNVTASSGPVAAMVQTDGLPFVTFANFSGSYLIPALAGTVNLTATVLNTAISGTNTVQVSAGQTATANITVTAQTEMATITPANGAVGVPLTAEIDITAPDPFDQTTVTATSVTLSQNANGTSTPVPVRFVFSQGGTRLSVFPQSALQPSTIYTLAASGIANTAGGLISIPPITFTTQAITAPTFNPSALVFAMPDQNGNVAISAPANSFPAGTTILIVDQTNGVVESLTVFNDGSVTGQMPATINDVLSVTITAPDKTTTTFTVSQFVAADGTTAVGPGGGTVVGPGGTGIIIPQGALTQGVTFKLTPLDQTAFPVLPTWQGGNFGSGMRITDPAMPTFQREAKLAFPVPANAPTDATYYVYRRLTDPSGGVYFETIDQAFVQGTGANAQVVTASPPFCGYHNSYAGFPIQASTPPLPITMESQDYFVMWENSQGSTPGMASQGLVVGLATQTVPAVPGVSPATTQPDPNPLTIFFDVLGTSNQKYVAIYDGKCATFTLFDPRIGGGARAVTATDGTTTLHATVNEVQGAQQDDGLYAIYAGLEDLYKNIGRVNFLFPAPTPPPPPPQLSIQLFTLNSSNLRVPASGILQTGTNIVIAFKSQLTVQGATVNGTAQTIIQPDKGETGVTEPNLLNARVQGLYPLGSAGTYTITATAIDPISLQEVSASTSVLVVAAGGGNTTVFTCTPPFSSCALPQVVSVSPQSGATGVSPTVFPQITFNEPVSQVTTDNVILGDITSNPPANSVGAVVPIQLIGIRKDGSVADPVLSTDQIIALTLEPIDGLAYGHTYKLTLNAKEINNGCLDANWNLVAPKANDGTLLITDTNVAPNGPLCLPIFPLVSTNSSAPSLPYTFLTYGPTDIGGATGQDVVTTRPVILGTHAYVGEAVGAALGGLDVFDISDPSHTADLGVSATFIGRPTDIAGQVSSPVTGGNLVAISAGMAVDNDIPGNVWLYDVTSPTPNRVGAVSVTNSAISAGIPLRLSMKDQFLYVSTFLQGLQVVDLGQAVAEYSQIFTTNPSGFASAVTTGGNGFATDTVVNTIPIQTTPPPGTTAAGNATMFDLKADDFTATTGSQTLVVATGQLPFLMADPTLSGSSAIVYPPSNNGTFNNNPVQPLLLTNPDHTYSLLCSGRAVALATISSTTNSGSSQTQHIAVVVGGGAIERSANTCPAVGSTSGPVLGPVLAVVDVSSTYVSGQPFIPKPLAFLSLPSNANDVTINGTIALLATGGNILMVNLANPSQPILAGQIDGNFGNWVTTNSSGLIVGSSNTGSNGIQLSSLGIVATLTASPDVMVVDTNSNSIDDIQFQYQINGNLSQVVSASIDITDQDGNAVTSIPIPVQAKGTASLPAGLNTPATPIEMKIQVKNSDGTPSALVDVSPEIVGGSTPTPVISSVSPARIPQGSSDTTITIKGRNFLPSTLAQFAQTLDLSGSNLQSVQFVNANQVQLKIPAADFLQPATWNLYLSNTFNLSNVVTIKVVPPGLPPAPTLTSISPPQLPATLTPVDTTISLQGSNFLLGDSVVMCTSCIVPPAFTVVSSTQIDVVIPESWSTFPLDTSFYVYSSQDADLQSQQMDFQVTNALGLILDPPEPQITAVNDGYVTLASSASGNPITLDIQGSSFDSAPQVVAVVDGQENPVPPTAVTPTSVQAQVPPGLFESKSLKAQMNVVLQGAITPAKGVILGTTALPKQRVKFQNPNKKDITDGFHSHSFSKIKNSEEAFLSVFPTKQNTVLAVLPDKHYLQSNVSVTFDGGPFLLQIPPASGQPPAPTELVQAQAYKEVITVNGTPAQGTILYPMTASRVQTPANGQPSTTKIGALGLQSLPSREFTLYVHFVGQGDPNDQTKAPTLVPDRAYDPVDWLATSLNAIWNKANVNFIVVPPADPNKTTDAQIPQHNHKTVAHHVDKVNYDTMNVDFQANHPDQALELIYTTGDIGTVKDTERLAILTALPIPAGNSINVYFVKAFDTKHPLVRGEAYAIGAPRALYVSDLGGGDAEFAQILAHEIGHTLGLTHNMETGGAKSGCPAKGNNPFIDYTNGDTDGSDEAQNALMWCRNDKKHVHIGSPGWFELNTGNPYP